MRMYEYPGVKLRFSASGSPITYKDVPALLRLKKILDEWRRANIVSIHKKGKKH